MLPSVAPDKLAERGTDEEAPVGLPPFVGTLSIVLSEERTSVTTTSGFRRPW